MGRPKPPTKAGSQRAVDFWNASYPLGTLIGRSLRK